MEREAWILDGVRSPRSIGKPGKGSLAHLHPQRLPAQSLNALQERVGFEPSDLDDVATGNTSNVADHAQDIGRMAVLAGHQDFVIGATIVERI